MNLAPAPYFEALTGAKPAAEAVWVTTSDDIRIRVAVWPKENAKGTVLLLPGRTEYVEKYAIVAQAMAERGYASLAIDWRGQGIADRLLEDRRIGHVDHFTDFQKDLAAALRVARAMELPRPWFANGHSMGGAIGLRAVMEGLPVQAVTFTGPMWGISMSPALRPVAWTLSHIGPKIGLSNMLAPSTHFENYVLSEPFEGNTLTTDPEMFQMMFDQMSGERDLALGGPSLVWFREALRECRNLARRPAPDLPCICFVGSEEKIVDVQAARDRMDRWPRGQIDIIDGGEHEILLEKPELRTHIYDRMDALFSDTMD